MDKLREELADEIAEAISDSIDMDWQPSWAVPAILEIIQRERMAAAEKSILAAAKCSERTIISEALAGRAGVPGVLRNVVFDAIRALDLSTIIGGESDA